MQRCVGGTVQHLRHDPAASTSVGAALDLDKRGHRVPGDEQVVERPPVAAILLTWRAYLSGYQKPPA